MNSPDIGGYCPMFGRLNSYEGNTASLKLRIHPKLNANGGSGMMLSVNCPKCQHVFSLGVCGGESGGSCRDGLALSGGGLIWPPTPSPTITPSPNVFFPFPSPPEQDLTRLAKTDAHLKLTGWYYQDFTWQQSQEALKNTAPGTYLVRDSSDHKFLYSLSVQTLKGPTSVRIHYNSGLFRLDAAPALAPLMPQFDCVVKLIEHYVKVTCARDNEYRNANGAWSGSRGNMWIDAEGGTHSPVEVRKPLLAQPPRLLHSARLAAWRAVRSAGPPALPLLSPVRRLGLPVPLQEYLEEYPYTC